GRGYVFAERHIPTVETRLAASHHEHMASADKRLPASPGETGQARFLPPEARKIQRKLHQTIKRVTDDFQGRWHFNTSIAAIMELVNELYATEDRVARTPSSAIPVALMADVQRDLVLLLAPFAPYLAHELWEMLGEKR